jgi:hypothetical protein
LVGDGGAGEGEGMGEGEVEKKLAVGEGILREGSS